MHRGIKWPFKSILLWLERFFNTLYKHCTERELESALRSKSWVNCQKVGLVVECGKLENEILKEAKNAQK